MWGCDRRRGCFKAALNSITAVSPSPPPLLVRSPVTGTGRPEQEGLSPARPRIREMKLCWRMSVASMYVIDTLRVLIPLCFHVLSKMLRLNIHTILLNDAAKKKKITSKIARAIYYIY